VRRVRLTGKQQVTMEIFNRSDPPKLEGVPEIAKDKYFLDWQKEKRLQDFGAKLAQTKMAMFSVNHSIFGQKQYYCF
jgi:hypothetical protein